MSLRVTLQSLAGMVYLIIEDCLYRYTGRKMESINVHDEKALDQYDRILFLRSFGLLNTYLSVSEKSRKQIPCNLHEFDNPYLYAYFYWKFFYKACLRYHMMSIMQPGVRRKLAS